MGELGSSSTALTTKKNVFFFFFKMTKVEGKKERNIFFYFISLPIAIVGGVSLSKTFIVSGIRCGGIDSWLPAVLFFTC